MNCGRTFWQWCGLWLLIFTLCDLMSTKAQVRQSRRFEREQKNNDENFTIIPLEREGIALVRQRNKYTGNKKLWETILLDTALNERSVVEFYLEERYPLIGYESTPGFVYLLFRTGDTNRNSFELVEINGKEMTKSGQYAIKPEVDFKITHFSKVGSNIALGGYVSNDPAILLYDLTTSSLKIVPGFFQKDNELVDLRVNQNQTFNVVLIDRSTRSDRKFVFRTFDQSGKLLMEDIVPFDDEHSPHTSITSTLKREELMVAGTWGDKQAKQSAGFFTLPIDPFGDQKIKYYSFGELNHFLDYLSPKRAERIRDNTRDDLQAGRRPSFSSYVIPFDLEESREGYFLLAEVYNPLSTSNPYYSNPYGNPYYNYPAYYYNPFWPGYYPGMRYRPYSFGNNVKNADEIKTFSTVLLSFDGNGNLQWDQSVKLDDVKRSALEQVTDFLYTKSALYFLYKKESELKIKKVDLEGMETTEESQAIMLLKDGDEVRDEKETEGGIKHWADNYFYVWGYQTIRNPHQEDRVRDVFYLNKVVVP